MGEEGAVLAGAGEDGAAAGQGQGVPGQEAPPGIGKGLTKCYADPSAYSDTPSFFYKGGMTNLTSCIPCHLPHFD